MSDAESELSADPATDGDDTDWLPFTPRFTERIDVTERPRRAEPTLVVDIIGPSFEDMDRFKLTPGVVGARRFVDRTRAAKCPVPMLRLLMASISA